MPAEVFNRSDEGVQFRATALFSLRRRYCSTRAAEVFILVRYIHLEQTLQFFELLWIHCWGTLKQLETEDYKAFIDTTYILYLDFINEFPQYKDDLPDEYSINEAVQLLNEYGSHPNTNWQKDRCNHRDT